MQNPAPLTRGVIGELFWKISDPVLLLRGQTVTAVNPAGEATLGLDADRVADKPISTAAVFDSAAPLFDELLRSGSSGRLECPHLGRTFFVSCFPVDEEHSGAVLRDVTNDEQHLASLRRLNETAREVLIQDSVEAVLQRIVDDAKHLTQASFSALLILKEDSEVEIAKFVYNAPRELFPDRLPRAVGLLQVAIKSRSAARLDDIREHPQGVGIPVEHPPIGPLLAVPIVAGTEVLGEIAVANQPGEARFGESDEAVLTDLGLLAAQAIRLAEAREASEAADSSRQAMLDLLRHDMMTPIATARGATDLLLNQFDALTQEQREKLLKALGRAIGGIERLGRNLRSDARLEAPRLPTEFSDIDVASFVAELEQDLQAQAQHGAVKIVTRSERDCPRSFRGSYLLVRQALENLLTNAIRFSPREREVVVTTRLEGGSIRFDVRDDGPGIPIEEQNRLFRRFAPGLRKEDLPDSGLGLGLSIVRRVAEAHGGSVGLASRPDQGSTFWITFPLNPTP